MQKIYRLTHNSSFNYVFRKGDKCVGKFLVIYNVKAGNLKVGVSVSKKVGNSVVRSKVKRRIKEAFRLLIPNIQKRENFVIVALSRCAEATYAEISAELRGLLKKSDLLIEEAV